MNNCRCREITCTGIARSTANRWKSERDTLRSQNAELVKACKAGARMLLRNTLQDAEDTAVYNQMKQAIEKAEGK